MWDTGARRILAGERQARLIGHHPIASRSRVSPELAVLAGLAASALSALLLYGPRPLIWLYKFSARQYDPPYLPDGWIAHPVIGGHYFGDWQLLLAWSISPDPYVGHTLGLNGLPPVIWMMRPFTYIPIPASLVLMVIASLWLTWAAVQGLMPDRGRGQQIIVWLGGMALSTGMLMSIDRGSMQAVVVGLVGLWLVQLRRGHSVAAGALLAVAIIIKPYLIFLLLWPLAKRAWRSLAATVAFVGVPSLIGFALLPGSFFHQVAAYQAASAHYASHNTHAHNLMMNTVSALSLIVHPVTLLHGGDTGREWLRSLPDLALIAPGVAWLALVAFLLMRRKVSPAVAVCFVLSLSQMVLPSMQVYACVWSGIGLAVLLSEPRELSNRLTRRAVEVALVVSVVPLPFTFGDHRLVPAASIISPLAWLIAGLMALLQRRSDDRDAAAQGLCIDEPTEELGGASYLAESRG